MQTLKYKHATLHDAPRLARMNLELIQATAHRNPMNQEQLKQRMAQWLTKEYTAIQFLLENEAIGYALYRQDPEWVYLRQIYIEKPYRQQGYGKQAILWLHNNVWKKQRLRIEVLSKNDPAICFWKALGFEEYALTMELEKPL